MTNRKLLNKKKMTTLNGTESGDRIIGGDESDAIFGGGGNDSLFAQSGNDRIYGEEGDDALYGRSGNDTLSGGNGNDTLYGTTSATVGVESDRDVLFGGEGNDTFRLGSTSQQLFYDLNADSDLAIIEDFESGEDKIVLPGNANLYTLASSGSNTNIYLDGEDNEDELIAIVKSNNDLSFATDIDFG